MPISLSEILLVLLILFLVVKPKDLPQIALRLGRLIRGLKNFTSKLKEDVFHEHRNSK